MIVLVHAIPVELVHQDQVLVTVQVVEQVHLVHATVVAVHQVGVDVNANN